MMNINELSTDIATRPISAQQPSGENVRYDDDFELLEDELSKQGALIDRGRVNWQKVMDFSVDILTEKSKDLKVSCYLTRALYELYDFKGLARGLIINQKLLDNYWLDLYPKKLIARANSYEWLSSKMEPLLDKFTFPSGKISTDFSDDIEHCYQSIKTIEDFLAVQLGKNAPALGKLRRSLNNILEQAKEQQQQNSIHNSQQVQPGQEQEINVAGDQANTGEHKLKTNARYQAGESNKVSQVVQTAENDPDLTSVAQDDNHQSVIKNVITSVTNSVTNTKAITVIDVDNSTEKERSKLLKECQEAVRNIALVELGNNINSPSSYAKNRIATWLNINQMPMNKEGITPLRPIPADKYKLILEMFNQEKYKETILLAETSFSRSPFWLDAHRFVCQALELSGYMDSAIQVKEYLGVFLRRFPDIVNLKFTDQTDFADPQTKQWIKKTILVEQKKNITTDIKISTDTTNSDHDLEQVLEQADTLILQNQLKEAVLIFQNKIKQQSNEKQKIYWKYYLARFCYDNAQEQLAVAILKEIDGFILNNNLQCWEPDLARNVTGLLYQSLKISTDKASLKQAEENQLEGSIEASESASIKGLDSVLMSQSFQNKLQNNIQNELTQLYTRLCQLDPVLALEIS